LAIKQGITIKALLIQDSSPEFHVKHDSRNENYWN